MNSKEIEILATPSHDSNYCLFSTNVELLNGKYICSTPENAKGSPLLEKLFSTGFIKEITVENNKLLLQKNSELPWNKVGPQVGKIIRETYSEGTFLNVVPEAKVGCSSSAQKEVINEKNVNSILGKKIKIVLMEKVLPSLAAHGGSVTLVDVVDSQAVLSFSGGCQGCSQVGATVKEGIERVLKEELPDLKGVIDATDHRQGTSPYYA